MKKSDLKKGAEVMIVFGKYKGSTGVISRALDKGTSSARAKVKMSNGSVMTLASGYMQPLSNFTGVHTGACNNAAAINDTAANDINAFINSLVKCMANAEEFKRKYM